MDKHDLIGLKVANDGSGLRRALEAHYQIKSLEHIGNFTFCAELDGGGTLLIETKSVDLDMQTIRILSIQESGNLSGDRSQVPFEVTAKLKVTLTGQDIDDIMVAALEGGITYWCAATEVRVGKYLGKYASDQISRGGTLLLYDRGSDAKWELTLEKFLHGVKLYLEQEKDAANIIDHGKLNTLEVDACVADSIIQYALFGEIVFG